MTDDLSKASRDRRKRYKVEDLGAAELVDELLARGLGYEEIAALVEENTGQAIGKSSIARYNQDYQRRLQRIARMREAGKALKNVLSENDGELDTSNSELLLAMIEVTLLDKLGEDDLSPRDLAELSKAGASSARANAAIKKIKIDEEKRFKAAFNRMAGELKVILESSGLWEPVESVMSAWESKVFGEARS